MTYDASIAGEAADAFAGSVKSSCPSSDSPSNPLQHHVPVHRARAAVGFESVNQTGAV